MKRTRVSLPEKSEDGQKQNRPSRQQRQKLSTAKPKTIKRKLSVNKVNTRNNKEQTTEEKLTRKKTLTRKLILRHRNRAQMKWKERQRNQHQCRM